MKLPTFDSLMNPLLRALRALGGSGSVDEIYDKVVELESIPEDVLGKLHDPEKSNQSEVAYRLAWARTYLKKYGLLENSIRGVWALTPKAKEVVEVDSADVVKLVRGLAKKQVPKKKRTSKKDAPGDSPDEDAEWREKLHHILTKTLDPSAFERLTQRLLRESGFVQVEVTGRSGDGGIDGKGIARIHGFMSFHVFFQCKRYQGSVSAGAIRDFRGAMVGRADKGLFITTGTTVQ
jgi:restriction system protein